MAKNTPAFQFYAADFDGGTRHWHPCEVGMYLRLLMCQWINGPLPDDEERLRRVTGATRSEWGGHWPTVSEKFVRRENGTIVNERLEAERSKQSSYRNKLKAAGHKGAEVRWGSETSSQANSHPNSEANGHPIREAHDQNMPLQSSTSVTTTPPSPPGGGALPAWSEKLRTPKGVTRREVVDSVVRIIGEITGRDADPNRCAGSAKAVLTLWRSIGYPPLPEFEADAALVARAARDCPVPLFARDIRAEGWEGGSDRSRQVPTLMVQKWWDDRLEAARQWSRGHVSDDEFNDPHSQSRHGLPTVDGQRKWCSRAGEFIPKERWLPWVEAEA